MRAERWGPRTLDVDLLDVGGLVLDDARADAAASAGGAARRSCWPRGSTSPRRRSSRRTGGSLTCCNGSAGAGCGAPAISLRAVNPTRPRDLVIAGALALVVSYVLMRVYYLNSLTSALPRTPVISVAIVALVEARARPGVRARLAGRPGTKPIMPITVARFAALARASSIAGAVVAGAGPGYCCTRRRAATSRRSPEPTRSRRRWGSLPGLRCWPRRSGWSRAAASAR